MRLSYDIAVVGAGSAGLIAGIEAAKLGARIAIFDENSLPGGQLFKQIHKFFGSQIHQAGIRGFNIGNNLLQQAQDASVKIHLDTAIVGVFKSENFELLAIENNSRCYEIEARSVIIATGASENPLAFDGWTLPGVMGAGAAQTMININRTHVGKKVLMVGSGNVGLIVSYQLLQAGADVVALVEAMPKVSGYLVHAAKLSRRDVPIICSHTIISAKGDDCVERAVIAPIDSEFNIDYKKKTEFEVDTVCLAVGLNPMSELLRQMRCPMHYSSVLGGFVPLHDRNMQTPIRGVYVAGDVAGVEEASTAMEEGRVAGISAAQSLGFDNGSASAEIERTWDMLNALRSGPFGEKRFRAKQDLINVEGVTHGAS